MSSVTLGHLLGTLSIAEEPAAQLRALDTPMAPFRRIIVKNPLDKCEQRVIKMRSLEKSTVLVKKRAESGARTDAFLEACIEDLVGSVLTEANVLPTLHQSLLPAAF